MTGPGLLAATVAGAGLLLAACVPQMQATSPAAFDQTWQIVGHKMPGVSALDDTQAKAWYGRFVHLQAHRAQNGVDTCDDATYVERTVEAGPFLDTEYRVRPAALGVGDTARLRVLEVRCRGEAWPVLGGRVLSFGDAGDFAVWDGVFFVLRRVHL